MKEKCIHNWKKVDRPYQNQIDQAEGRSFMQSKIWIVCDKCTEVACRTRESLSVAVPKRFLDAGALA